MDIDNIFSCLIVHDSGLAVKQHCPFKRGDWRSGWCCRLQNKGSLVRVLARSPFVVALSKSHLTPALYWLNPGSRGHKTDLY